MTVDRLMPEDVMPEDVCVARNERVRILFGSIGWPSGVLDVASWIRRRDWLHVVIVPVLTSGWPDRETLDSHTASMILGRVFIRKLLQFEPHVIGFRLEAECFDAMRRMIQAVRFFSDAEIVLGGPSATSHPCDVLRDVEADYVFTGEAEEPFEQFLRLAWQRNSNDRQPEIPGLTYRFGGQVYLNTLPRDGYQRSVLDSDRSFDPNELVRLRNRCRPVANAQLIGANRLDWSLLEGFDEAEPFESLFFTGGRGCPGACTFCAKLHGRQVRVKSAQQLLEEIESADACVASGKIRVGQWPLWKHTDDPTLQKKQVAWAAVYDEDFFLHRHRAIEFFRLWANNPLKDAYRISLQTNPRSMLTTEGKVDKMLIDWIDQLKPMVQLGAESFHDGLLARWNKRHRVEQLNTVLDALDRTGQDYTVFQLLTDFDSTPEELIETIRLLVRNALPRRRMRIASSPFTIPLFDSDTRALLEHAGRLTDRIKHYTDFEQPQPGWMNPLVAEMADLADAELAWTLQPEYRDAALVAAMEVLVHRLRKKSGIATTLLEQAERAMDEIREYRFNPWTGL